MKTQIIFILCCILLLASCGSRNLTRAGEARAVSEPLIKSEQESAAPKTDSPQIPQASSFCTIILAQGERTLPEDDYALAGKELEEFQNALKFSQWREPVGYQPKGEFLFPCVMAEGDDGSVMYISPANRDYVFDDTVIFIKYGENRQYSTVYFAPGEVAQDVEALRAKWKEAVRFSKSP